MKEWLEIPTFSDLEKLYPDIKYCFFDLDGTLLDTEVIHMKSVQKVLNKALNEEFTLDFIIEKFYGLPDRDAFSLFIKERGEKSFSFEKFYQSKNYLLEESVVALAKEGRLINEKMSFLINEMEKANWSLAIITASGRFFLDLILQNINKNQFKFHLSCEDTKKTKPHPMPYLKGMELMGGIKPSEVLIFEDSPTGIKSATESGGIVNVARWFNN